MVTSTGERLSAGPVLSGSLLQATVRVGTSTVVVAAERTPVVNRAREATILVGGLALLAVATAVALALAQARRLTRPLSELLDRADALGRGQFDQPPLHSGIEEIDGVSRVLDRSAQDIAAMIDLQRHFAGDAAHQLRTPLTGIGLRLDELTGIGDQRVRREAEDALAQVDRLDRVITSLLARARGDAAPPTLLDLSALLIEEGEPWTRALQAQGRDLVLTSPSQVWIKARREHVAGIISCLLDNALRHGVGEVRLTAQTASREVIVHVSDEGSGVPVELSGQVFDRRFSSNDGTGIGLSLARSLAVAEVGRLTLAAGSEFLLSLPQAQGS